MILQKVRKLHVALEIKKKTGLNDNRHKIIFLPFRVKITGFGHWRNSDGGGQRGESSPGKLHVKTGPALSL